jgi:hypothetical protein
MADFFYWVTDTQTIKSTPKILFLKRYMIVLRAARVVNKKGGEE